MVGGTAASFMIFFLPGLLLINAAIVKRSAEVWHLPVLERRSATLNLNPKILNPNLIYI